MTEINRQPDRKRQKKLLFRYWKNTVTKMLLIIAQLTAEDEVATGHFFFEGLISQKIKTLKILKKNLSWKRKFPQEQGK